MAPSPEEVVARLGGVATPRESRPRHADAARLFGYGEHRSCRRMVQRRLKASGAAWRPARFSLWVDRAAP